MNWIPSQDQQAAIEAIREHLSTHDEAILCGAAGTGKTWTLLQLLKSLPYTIMFFAPTGKASLRVKEQTQHPCSTIHSGYYTSVDEKSNQLSFSHPSPPEGSGVGTLWIIDEASMVSKELADMIREMQDLCGAKILWVGDDEQLPPVDGKWGVYFPGATAKLTTVHRQDADSNILDLATCVRMGKYQEFNKWENDTLLVTAEPHDAVKWLRAVPNAGLITYTNATRKLVNFLYRRDMGYAPGQIHENETILVTMNNSDKGLVNGQTIKVKSVREYEEMSKALKTRVCSITFERELAHGTYDQMIYVLPELFDRDTKQKNESELYRETLKRLYDVQYHGEVRMATGWDGYTLRMMAKEFRNNLIQCTWGYCLTVHKSQGSQWDVVGFISCGFFRKTLTSDPDFGKRLYYTAITRAAKTYVEFNCAYIPKIEDVIDPPESPNDELSLREKIEHVTRLGGQLTVKSKASGQSMKFIFKKVEDKESVFVNFAVNKPSNYVGMISNRKLTLTKASKYDETATCVKTLRWILSTKESVLETDAEFTF